MKFKFCYSVILALFSINSAMAQQSTEEEPQIIQTISVRKGESQQVHDKAYYEQKIKDIDELLKAIEVKTAYVKADENENKIAIQNGWYTNMDRVKEESLKQRGEYETIINKMRN